MFYRFLPLLIIGALVCLTLGTKSATTQDKPVEFKLEVFNPLGPAIPQADAPITFTRFDINSSAATDNRVTAPPVEAPAAASNMRISQIYTRGGETGATYSNDYIEIFNAGNTTVDINGWGIVVNTVEGSTPQAIGARYNTSFSVTPGMHLLVRFAGNGPNGQPLSGLLPTINDISLGSSSGQITLLSPTQQFAPGCPSSVGPNGAVSDLVGYGATTCAEGTGLPAPQSNKALTRINGGCTDTDNNNSDFSSLDPNPRNFQATPTPCGAQPTPTATPTATPTPSPSPSPTPTVGPPSSGNQFNFSSSQYELFGTSDFATITVVRSGDLSTTATVNFATSDGTATGGLDYIVTSGTLNFAPGVAEQTFRIGVIDDTLVEPDETINLTLSNPTGNAVLGPTNTSVLVLHDNDSATPETPKIRISQVYPRGGEPGATYQRDFIELFNADTKTINLQGWALIISSFNSAGQTTNIGALITASINLVPGQHVILTMPGTGSNGQALAAEFNVDFISLSSDGATVYLIQKDHLPPVFICPSAAPDPRGAVVDFVGYGMATCTSGNPAPIPPPNKSLTRIGTGCTDTFDNKDDFALTDPNPRKFSSPLSPQCGVQPTSTIEFSSSQFTVNENAGAAHITVTRTGDLSVAAGVDYLTNDLTPGTANERSDYNRTAGTLRFAPGESTKTFDVLITDDTLQEPTETVTFDFSKVSGNGTLGARRTTTLSIIDNDSATGTTNPVDASPFYVDQHYHDFLNRVPDSSGLQFWINNIESCTFVQSCREVKRIDTSAAFFLSIEFQKTGLLVYRTFRAAYSAGAERPRGFVRYREFMQATQAISQGVIVGNPGYEALLEANTRAFFPRFTADPEFLAIYPTTMTPAQYVDALNAHTGNLLTSTERSNLIDGLLQLRETRATVLRKVAENQAFTNAEFNRGFVLMQYFGYLRRNPDDLPDHDFSGFDFWLNKLNQFNGNYIQAEMVKAFLTSIEYRRRFGP